MDYDALTRGLDVSHWNVVADWSAVAASGIRFVYAKASQGGKADPNYTENVAGAREQGILCLPYAFVTADDRPATVAAFVKQVGPVGAAVLDWEEEGVPSSVVETWIDGLAKAGIRVLVYYGVDPPAPPTPKITACPRILPEYASAPRLPAWDGRDVPSDWSTCWLIWQRSSSSENPGVIGPADLDVLAIDLVRFKSWCDTGDFLTPDAPAPVEVDPAENPEPVPAPPRLLRYQSPPMTGPDVSEVQRLLGTVMVDGVYGIRTRDAIRALQEAHDLRADGIVGPATLAALGGAAPR